MSRGKVLLDVNVLMAVLDDEHVDHVRAYGWLEKFHGQWGTCAFTEAAYLRLITSSDTGGYSLKEAREALDSFTCHPEFSFWPIQDGWVALALPFMNRIQGPKQINDAYLLGLAVKHNGILVTFDKGIRHLAGERYSKNVLVLE